jgi:magnesium-transporting ATPase (P-type)
MDETGGARRPRDNSAAHRSRHSSQSRLNTSSATAWTHPAQRPRRKYLCGEGAQHRQGHTLTAIEGERAAVTTGRAGAAPVREVLQWLDTSEGGLSGAEASARLLRNGPNAVRTHRVSALAVLGRQLRSAVLGLLAVTAVLSFFLGDSQQAIIIGIILAASIGLGFVNE